jgi:hypothetical protein
MLIDAVAFVQDNDGGPFAFGFRERAHGANAAAVFDHRRDNSSCPFSRHVASERNSTRS